ncbi:HAMP domain-containing sensor histidine kinase [Crenobacter sp. SG2303]|uniref:histidine kinase n=1 Tax=Crenobacter oryzisoli TaxID=3056844 RepID=A0ABT7XKK6_9NEIS|nr:HAMP domain-containing sensor histidine kinase [Crenobacter sp. SG2303]MDN0074313.1 HAMP domain-containing sensor histidine kinase [Crenobacter sp. SG2303]
MACLLLAVLLPSLALLQLWHQFDSVVHDSVSAQQQTAKLTNAIRLVSEQATVMERGARQFVVLDDASFRQGVDAAWNLSEPALQQLAAASPTPAVVLAQYRQRRRELNQLLDQREGDLPLRMTLFFDQLARDNDRLGAVVKGRIVQREQQMRERFAEQRRAAGLMVVASAGLALLLALLIGHRLAQPVVRLRRRIQQLGDGQRGLDWKPEGPADLRELAHSLQELDTRLTELENDKSRFFRHVSHELKTPLAALNEGAALLSEQILGPLNPAQQEVIGIVRDNVQLLRQRIDALLRQDAEQLRIKRLDWQRFNLQGLLDAHIEQNRLLINGKQLTIDLCHGVGWTHGDADKVGTIVDNLLINAIRFSPNGGALRLETSKEQGRVTLTVSDQGPGVAEADRERIFEPFYCGQVPAGEVPGSGIGLSMAQGFAQQMGGNIELISRTGEGARFRLWWPDRAAR